MKLENSRKIILVTMLVVLISIAIFAGVSVVSFVMIQPKNIPSLSVGNTTTPKVIQSNEGHVHAALMVFIKGRALDLSDETYQNQDLMTHFENGDGVTLHNHSKRAWLGMLFRTMNMTLANNCLTLNNGTSYCSDFDNQISFVVNGIQNPQFQHYIPKDGDRILVSYGDPEQIKREFDVLNSTAITGT